MVIGLLILGAMTALFMNTSTGNREMARANGMIENGRLAIELLESDVVHAGYWGGYMPTFDDQTFETRGSGRRADGDSRPLPALHYAMDGGASRQPGQHSGAGLRRRGRDRRCPVRGCHRPGSRAGHRHTRRASRRTVRAVGSGGNCEAETLGKLYFQAARCSDELPGYVLAAEDGNAAPSR